MKKHTIIWSVCMIGAQLACIGRVSLSAWLYVNGFFACFALAAYLDGRKFTGSTK